MRLSVALLPCLLRLCASLALPQTPLAIPQTSVRAEIGYEDVRASAAHARRLIASDGEGIGFLSTDDSDRPAPLLQMEYYAGEPSGDVYLLAMPISRNWRNALSSGYATLSVMDNAGYRKHGRIGATDRARIVAWLKIERVNGTEAELAERLYVEAHADADDYVPPKGPHLSIWVRGIVQSVYWIGGFGDEHYIGEIPLDLYRGV